MKTVASVLVASLFAMGLWAADAKPAVSAKPAAVAHPVAKATKKNPVIVVVDVGRLVRESEMAKGVQEDFSKWSDQKRALIEPKKDELKKKQEAFKAGEPKLSASEKDAKQKELTALLTEINKLQQEAQQEYQGRQQAADGRLRDIIMPVMESLAKENGWDIILSKADRLLWTSDVVDQTDTVLVKLNSMPVPKAAAEGHAPKK